MPALSLRTLKQNVGGRMISGELGLESTKDYIEKNMIETLPYINLGSNTYIKSIHAGKHFLPALSFQISNLTVHYQTDLPLIPYV